MYKLPARWRQLAVAILAITLLLVLPNLSWLFR